MFQRVVTFGKNNKTDFPAGSVAAAEFAAIDSIVADLNAAQAGVRDRAVVGKGVLLDALRLDAKNVWRTAYAIGQKEPGFAERFKQPDGAGEAPLLVAVDATIDELEKPGVTAKFIAHDLPKGFVAELKASRDAAASARSDVESSRQTNVQSNAAIDRLITSGLEHVTTLNAIMHNKYSRVPEKLRAWKSAIHIERTSRTEKPGAAEEGATEAAQPATT
jgi:hypothetical protein